MVKKRKRKPKRKRKVKKYHGKTEREWEQWGKTFGKMMESKGKKWEKECRDWWFRTFGFIGPLIGSIFGIICLAVGIFVLNLINLPLGSTFISRVSNFLLTNIHWFFAAFLFFGYSDYFSKRYPKTYWIVSPVISSIGAVIMILISIWILNLINIYVNSTLIASLSNFLYVNLGGIFILLLVLGYVVVVIKKAVISSLRV